MSLYPPLPPVEVGEWLRYESSYDPDHGFVQVERLTPQLLHACGGKFSREHGAEYVGFGLYDAYVGRVRKLTAEDRAELGTILAEQAAGNDQS